MFVEGCGTQEYVLAKYGLDASSLVSRVLEVVRDTKTSGARA
jgi:hypothetical protein